MFSPADYKELLSGRQRGIGAALLRCGLRVAEPLYGIGVWWRNRAYDRRSCAWVI
jgi:hypothetical protein